jgi:hypothetical protein
MVKTFLVTLFLLTTVIGQSRPTSFIEKRVTFTIPAEWQIQSQEDKKTLGSTQIFIPYALTDDTPHSANATIVANIVPEKVTVEDLCDRIRKQSFPGMAIVNDLPDGKNWRTMVWTAQIQGLPYLALHRFGVVNRVAVEFMVAFPLFEKGDTKWVERTITDFNHTCENLKIDGTNSTEAMVRIDKLPAKQ